MKRGKLIMAGKIEVIIKNHKFKIRLNDSKTSRKILSMLPVTSYLNTWGNEIYFSVPMEAKLENGAETLDIGTVAFWPPGSALCIFFGKTPASAGEKPQAASPVTIVGSVEDKKSLPGLKKVKAGEKIEVKIAE
jgi:hypothetical protein